jgi:hypothetical protein
MDFLQEGLERLCEGWMFLFLVGCVSCWFTSNMPSLWLHLCCEAGLTNTDDWAANGLLHLVHHILVPQTLGIPLCRD